VLALGEGLQHIQAEQEYMKMRERIHRNSKSPSTQPSCSRDASRLGACVSPCAHGCLPLPHPPFTVLTCPPSTFLPPGSCAMGSLGVD